MHTKIQKVSSIIFLPFLFHATICIYATANTGNALMTSDFTLYILFGS